VLQNRYHWLTGCAAFAALAAVLQPRGAGAQTAPSIKIAAGQIVAQGQAYFAQDQGYFRDRGLDTSITTFHNGAAGAAAVAGHDTQIGVSSVLQIAQAHAHNLPFVIIAPGGIHESPYHVSGLLVAAASPVVSAKELNGKIIGVATLNGLDELAARALIDRAGGDSSTVKFVEIPPSATVDALTQGRIAASNVEDPERSTALRSGVARTLGDGEDAIGQRFVQTAWYTTTDWLAANKDAARRFAAAIYQAGSWAMAAPDKAALIMQKYLAVPGTPSAQRFATAMQVSEFQPILDTAARYNLIPATSASTLVWNGR
jgi:NitT/TauT family transport system substrate-binding protein